MAAGIRIGYPEIFKRNEYAYKLDKGKLTDILVEMTGLDKSNGVIRNIVGTFGTLNGYADFDQPATGQHNTENTPQKITEEAPVTSPRQLLSTAGRSERVGMNLSYTINLNLPETTNVEVFNSIFRALKENMLQ